MKKKVLLILLFFVMTLAYNTWISPSITNATEMPGARSATSEAGDVFLGGNYIEVGINKNGSFGTSTAAPESFHSHALSQYNYQLGLITDGDGWDVGNPPTSGDFFLPGGPYEAYVINYKIADQQYSYTISERTGSTWGDNTISGPVVEDKSDIENGILKAVVTVVTKENVKVEITYEFGVNDKFYTSSAKFTNLGTEKITNASFMRQFDPDNDKDFNGTYDTYNKVVCTPDTTKEGSDTNYAMVVALGPITYNGFFFVAFDNRAIGSVGNITPSGLPTYATEDDLKISAEDTNGYTREDTWIDLKITFGDIDAAKSDEGLFYSSLDPDVLESIGKILKAVAASVKEHTDTRIEVETQEGYEY